MTDGSRIAAFERRIDISPPIGWQAITALLTTIAVTFILFVILTPYARVETVTGTLVPSKGVTQIAAQRAGIIAEILVEDGQWVEAGTELIVLRTEQDLPGGRSAGDEIAAALKLQQRSLATQGEMVEQTLGAQRSQIATQAAGERDTIRELQTQITLQDGLIQIARADLSRAEEVAKRGFISERDLDNRRATLTLREQERARLNSALATSESTLRELAVRHDEIAAQSESQLARLRGDQADLTRTETENEGGRVIVLQAPVAGNLTALTARVGQSVDGNSSLALIVPKYVKLQAELHIPSQSIGFVEEGQEVRLAIDAFPFQRFGTIVSSIRSVSKSPVVVNTTSGPVSAYIATADLSQASIKAFGNDENLLPGMTVSARVVTDNPTLIEWLFEPLLAVRRR